MAVAKGVLELITGSRRGEPDRAIELAFRASIGHSGGWVVQRWNTQGSIATRFCGLVQAVISGGVQRVNSSTIHAGVVNPWPTES